MTYVQITNLDTGEVKLVKCKADCTSQEEYHAYIGCVDLEGRKRVTYHNIRAEDPCIDDLLPTEKLDEFNKIAQLVAIKQRQLELLEELRNTLKHKYLTEVYCEQKAMDNTRRTDS